MKYRTNLLATGILALSVTAVSLSAQAAVLHFKNGDRLTGDIVSNADGRIVLQTSVGEVTIDETLVEKLDVAEAATAKAAQAVEKALAVAPPAPPEPEPKNWEGHIDFNTNVSRGNTDSQLMNLAADWKLQQEVHRYKAAISSVREEKDSVSTKEQDRLNLAYNYLFRDNWFFAMNGSLERDPIARIDHKYTLSPAVGYDIWDDANRTLNVQLGVGYTSEQTDIGDESGALVDWRLELSHKFPDWHVEAFHKHRIFRNLDGRENTVLNSQTGLRYNLTRDIHLNVQLDYDYDTEPVAGTEKDDLTFVFGAGVTI